MPLSMPVCSPATPTHPGQVWTIGEVEDNAGLLRGQPLLKADTELLKPQ